MMMMTTTVPITVSCLVIILIGHLFIQRGWIEFISYGTNCFAIAIIVFNDIKQFDWKLYSNNKYPPSIAIIVVTSVLARKTAALYPSSYVHDPPPFVRLFHKNCYFHSPSPPPPPPPPKVPCIVSSCFHLCPLPPIPTPIPIPPLSPILPQRMHNGGVNLKFLMLPFFVFTIILTSSEFAHRQLFA